jgi:nucleotide-binding universal stress UspA family protein
MKDIRNIMVAVDFSPISQHLVGYAWALGQKINAAIDLVNVINQRDVEALSKVADVTSTFSFPDELNRMREDRLTALMALLSDLDIPPDAIGRHVRTGIPSEVLLTAIKEFDSDLLIMGTRGRGQFAGMLFGSNAARMLSKCPVPLLTLRNEW